MTLKEFIRLFDKANAVVLVEGKREVQPADRDRLVAMGKLLARETRYMTFRSGNAKGADHLFSDGISSVDGSRLQVITPYAGHRQKVNVACQTISLDEIDIASEPQLVYQSRSNKRMRILIDQYVAGGRDRYSIKAACIIRDTLKAVGTSEIKPANFGIFYDDLKSPRTGGAGNTMSICEQIGIPVIDQNIWFRWLQESEVS